MRRIVTVAVREFVETVKTKMFVISVVMMPLLILGFVFGTDYISQLAEQEQVPPRKIAVVDQTGAVMNPLAVQMAEYNEANPNRPFELLPVPAEDAELAALRADVLGGELYAYVVVPPGLIADDAETNERCEFGRKDAQMTTGRIIHEMLNEAVVEARFNNARPAIDRERVKRLERPVNIREIDLQSGTEEASDQLTRMLTPFAFMFLMWMGILGISHGLLTSVIEEKNSRIVEVLLSAVSPTELMAGKILGMALVGVLLIGVWGCVGFFVAEAQGAGSLVNGARLTYVLIYFVPGFLFASALLAGIGSVCNTLKEAQSMTFPQSILTLVPMIMWLYLTQYPHSWLSVVISYIPPITPYVMILRICADPHIPMWQIVTTLAVLWVSVIGVIWAAGKVFRVGVLMYGKPPSPRELLRWLRYA